MRQLIQIQLNDIIFDETIYPRKDHNPAKVQEYAENIEAIEALENYIEISANNKLLDGKHKFLAYQKLDASGDSNGKYKTIQAFKWVDITEEKDEFVKAIELNSSHGQQISPTDKDQNCRILYSKYGYTQETICDIVKVSKTRVSKALKSIRDEEKKQQDLKIFEMHLACYTQEEIAEAVGDVTQKTISNRLEELRNKVPTYFISKLFDHDDSFNPPKYNVWTFDKNTSDVKHFGNSEQRIVDNLLWLYTKPYDIVLDPFAGSGSTIDVCKNRLRRYYVSDRKPIVERAREIRQLDIVTGLPDLNGKWKDVKLTYLDPPYWKQAEGKYSKDAEDLANMPLDKFTEALVGVVNRIAEKQQSGVIALIIQPTQWKSDSRQFVDHVFDVVKGANQIRLELENRISVPYSTQQYLPQHVEWAKDNKKLLVLTRELVVWRIR